MIDKLWPDWLKTYTRQSIKNRRRWKALRESLMAEDPHCFWCGVEVIYFKVEDNVTMPKNFATLDHIHDSLDYINRYHTPEGLTKIVLACNECNGKRSVESQKKLGKDKVKKLSNLGAVRPKGTPRPIYFRDAILKEE